MCVCVRECVCAYFKNGIVTPPPAPIKTGNVTRAGSGNETSTYLAVGTEQVVGGVFQLGDEPVALRHQLGVLIPEVTQPLP